MKTIKEIFLEAIEVYNKDLVKAVEDYVFKNNPKYANKIAKFKNGIPPMFRSSKKLYRGMILDDKSFSILENGKFVLKDISSWTSNKKIAESFVNDPKKIVGNKKGIKVILVKDFNESEIILDIQSYITFLYSSSSLDEFGFDDLTREMAIDEQETLVDKKVKLNKKNIYKVF